MRNWTLTVIGFTLTLGLVGLAGGQQGGGGFRFGGGGGQRLDPVQLLNNASVKKELDISEEQTEKIPDAVMKALSDVLSEAQLKRFKEIELQQRGSNAFADAKIQDALKLSADQRSNINTILEDSRKEMKELFGGGAGGGFKGGQEKLANLRKETTTKVTGVLTAEQRKTWRQMTGEPFTIQFQGFGGGGTPGKGKGNNKKTDN